MALAGTIWALSACGPVSSGDQASSEILTVVLTRPDASGSAVEPTVAVDPDDPDRIVVVAQYGTGYNRGGLRFWGWSSADGGGSWTSSEVVPRSVQRDPTMAADASLSFDHEGHVLLAGLYGDDIWDGVEVPKAAIALAVSEDGGGVFRPREVYGEEVEYSPTHFVGSDKPWMIVDHGQTSPYEGSVYLVWTRVTVRLDPDPPVITRALVLSFMRRDGSVMSQPNTIANGGHGAQIAVRRDGTVDVVWLQEDETSSSQSHPELVYASSSNGGSTFSSPVTLASLSGTTQVFDPHTLAMDTEGRTLACWPRSNTSGDPESGVWCGTLQADGSWSEPFHIGGGAGGVIEAYPALAGAIDGW